MFIGYDCLKKTKSLKLSVCLPSQSLNNSVSPLLVFVNKLKYGSGMPDPYCPRINGRCMKFATMHPMFPQKTINNQPAVSWPSFFSAQGPLAEAVKGYESRPQQIQMAESVQKALDQQEHLVVEAGTGVGKSLAYLLPCALWAVQNNKKVIVSTHTKALQEQLVQNDLPLIQSILNEQGLDFRFSLLMGANNYLCLDRLARCQNPQMDLLESPLPAGLMDNLTNWAKTAQTGLRTQLPVKVPDHAWRHMCRDTYLCLGRKSPFYKSCLYQKDLNQARKSHIVVVNHHLFFAGLPVDNIDAVVFDEAHTLEDTASHYMGFSMNNQSFKWLLHEIYQAESTHGLAHRLSAMAPGWKKSLEKNIHQLHKQAQVFFSNLVSHTRLTASAHRFTEPLTIPDNLTEPLMTLSDLLSEAVKASQSAEHEADIRSHLEKVMEIIKVLTAFYNPFEPDKAYWMESTKTKKAEQISLFCAPVDVSDMLNNTVFSLYNPVILTSATLAVGRSFQIIKSRLGLGESLETFLDSPFPFHKQAALHIEPNMPDPKTDPVAYEMCIVDKCIELCDCVPGGIFVLFTSWALLGKVHDKLKHDITDRPVFKQGQSLPFQLIEKFKKAKNGILLGTDTFWQGVDVPGQSLSCVVITRLPFASPSAPLEQAKMEYLEKQGKNVFNEYTVPKAIIKFRQGFGRLIRTQTDVGAVVILDPRVQTKSYGQAFLHSLPVCKTTRSKPELKVFFENT